MLSFPIESSVRETCWTTRERLQRTTGTDQDRQLVFRACRDGLSLQLQECNRAGAKSRELQRCRSLCRQEGAFASQGWFGVDGTFSASRLHEPACYHESLRQQHHKPRAHHVRRLGRSVCCQTWSGLSGFGRFFPPRGDFTVAVSMD